MAWYWWALIVVALVVVGALKLRLFGKILQKRKAATEQAEEE